jgi:hypothetical protein
MKKKLSKRIKLTINKETLTCLDQVYAGNRTVDITACVTNCPACDPSALTFCPTNRC